VRLARKAAARILDFDVECRPLSWYGGDWVTKEVTAIAWGWVSPSDPAKVSGRVECRLLGAGMFEKFTLDYQLEQMLYEFGEAYERADIVTGHFIRGFDLPLLNGACLELGLPPLESKLTHDTKGDLVRFSGLSKSQENLGAMLGLRHPKVGMDQASWRSANRLTPEGIERTKKRVMGDVRQHVEMRAALLDRGMLGPPRPWSAGGKAEKYLP
jgi:hypothetical protein